MNINKIQIKRVAFPHEHGAWGFFIEPLLLALLISYSVNGLLLAFSSFLFFLAHQSIRILFRQTPKQAIFSASIFLAFYMVVSFSVLVVIYFNSEDYYFFIPYLTAMFLMSIYLILELKNLNRSLIIEMLAPISVVLIALSFTVINNWSLSSIIVLGIILLSRSIPTILYVNNKLKYFKGHKPNTFIVHFIGVTFLIVISIFVMFKLGSVLAITGNLLLITRAYIGFLPKNKKENVKTLGMKEFLFGFIFVIIIAIGYIMKI